MQMSSYFLKGEIAHGDTEIDFMLLRFMFIAIGNVIIPFLKVKFAK